MKKETSQYSRQRKSYQRLYRKLLFIFIQKHESLFDAKNDADAAFLLMTGCEFDYVKQDVSGR